LATILEIVEAYGPLVYGLLFLYTATKSGALPLFAGYAAQAGALDVAAVSAMTFSGGYIGDELRFAVARRYGAAWLARWPRIAPPMARAVALLNRYGQAYVFLYRYPKGLRTVGAFPVGLTAIHWGRFTRLNAASAALWTTALVGIGYVLGPWVEEAVSKGSSLASFVLLALFLALAAWLWRRPQREAAHAASGSVSLLLGSPSPRAAASDLQEQT
jgi:membrane protein DedA with SNARE-associated domain